MADYEEVKRFLDELQKLSPNMRMDKYMKWMTKNPDHPFFLVIQSNKVLEESKQEMAEKDRLLAEKDKTIAEKDKRIAEKDKRIAEKDKTIADNKRQLEQANLEKANFAKRLKTDEANYENKVLEESRQEMAQKDQTLLEKDKAIADDKRHLEQADIEKANLAKRLKTDQANYENKVLEESKQEMAQKDRPILERDRAIADDKRHLEQADIEKANFAKRLKTDQANYENKVLEERKQEMAEKDRLLAAKDNIIVEQQVQLCIEKKRLQRVVDELSEISLRSIKATYLLPHTQMTGDTMTNRLKKLELNMHCRPSFGHARKKQPIPNAIIYSNKLPWGEGIRVPIYHDHSSGESGKKFVLVSSDLPIKEPIRYVNEVDIQDLVKNLTSDALRCILGGEQQEIELHREVSLYGLTPDIIVVTWDKRVVFVIEVKVPEHGNFKVFGNPKVGGQIWLYLMAMRQLGVEQPLGAIATYNKIQVVSLGDIPQEELDTAKSVLSSEYVARDLFNRAKPQSKETISPLPDLFKVSEKNKRCGMHSLTEHDFDKKFKSCNGDHPVRSHILVSDVYEEGMVFPVLLHALRVALVRIDLENTFRTLPLVVHNEDLGSRLFARANETSIVMVSMNRDLTARWGPFPNCKANHFYMLAKLGAGSCAEVHLVCTTTGILAAAKMFISTPSQDADPSERKKIDDKRRKIRAKERDEEFDRWLKLFPQKQYANMKARKLNLANHPALLMPYGRALSDVDERVNAVNEIESELRRYAEAGFHYRSNDLRWRHVMRNSEGALFIADLQSLEEIPKDMGKAKRSIKLQLDQLLERMHEEEAPLNESKNNRVMSGRIKVKRRG